MSRHHTRIIYWQQYLQRWNQVDIPNKQSSAGHGRCTQKGRRIVVRDRDEKHDFEYVIIRHRNGTQVRERSPFCCRRDDHDDGHFRRSLCPYQPDLAYSVPPSPQ